ncbi:MAG: hypothetical protein PHG07_04285 [Lachnospiraceae bacterium]|nr:hypothetical protein [Lachnospiraceae bacterium]
MIQNHQAIVDAKAKFRETAEAGGKIGIWGSEATGYPVVTMQLTSMKETFWQTEDLSACDDAEILFICKNSYTDEELEVLTKYSEAGMTLFFTRIPSQKELANSRLKELLGISAHIGRTKKLGIRFTEDMMFGTILENEQIFYMDSISLKQQTEVYAAALEDEDVKDEELTPMFWRYQKDGSYASVYVAAEKLMEESSGYALVSFLFTDLNTVYMYPVVNAYCFIVSGMPYIEAYDSDYLKEQYERGSMGVQNDIFFPEIRRCEERYGVRTTWYGEDKDILSESKDAMLLYYLNEIEEQRGELGSIKAPSMDQSVDSPFDNKLSEWSSSYMWFDADSKKVIIPYHSLQNETYENAVFYDYGMGKGLGFCSVYIDVEAFLEEKNSEDQDEWIDFCRTMETVIGIETKDLSWLERMTVGEAIYRIQSFYMIEPDIVYSDSQIDVNIKNFTDKAFFYLSMPEGNVIKAENALVTQIDDGFYLVEARKEHIVLTY